MDDQTPSGTEISCEETCEPHVYQEMMAYQSPAKELLIPIQL